MSNFSYLNEAAGSASHPQAQPMDLKAALNGCKTSTTSYTRLTDLREESPYMIVSMERVTTVYGESVVVILEGQVGDDFFLRVFLPRRFSEAVTDQDIERYNSGFGDRLRLLKRSPRPGTTFTPLEFV